MILGAPLLSRDSMDGQNMGYTADNGGGYDQTYDANVDTNTVGSQNYQLALYPRLWKTLELSTRFW